MNGIDSKQNSLNLKKENLLKDKTFKILSGGRIDIKMKNTFISAWMIFNQPKLRSKLSELRLAEITIAVRAAEALAQFKTSLELDFLSSIESTVHKENINHYAKYLVRHLYYYRTELRNVDVSIEKITPYLQRKKKEIII